MEVTVTLDRAVAVLSREMANGGASMMQLRGAKGVVEALDIMVSASVMSTADASRLTALVQNCSRFAHPAESLLAYRELL